VSSSAVEDDGTHWVVEVKMDKEMSSDDLKGKREAARRWANHVTADEAVNATWHPLDPFSATAPTRQTLRIC